MNNTEPNRTKTQSFFAVEQRAFAAVLDQLGLSAAAVYLVLARGQGPLRRKVEVEDGTSKTVDVVPESTWSAKAVYEYTSITRPAAKKLIGKLVDLGAITVTRASTKPKYRLNPPWDIRGHDSLSKDLCWVWIPAKLVAPNKSDGPLISETVLERLLQTGQPSLLRALVSLYALHDLEQHSGVPFYIIHERYTRQHIEDSAEYRIWGFSKTELIRDDDCQASLEEISALQEMKLLDFVPHAVTRYDLGKPDDCLLLYPVPQQALSRGVAHEDELALGAAHESAASAMLPGWYNDRWAQDGGPDILVVERQHFVGLQVVGILRLVHRPMTGSTHRWLERRTDWEIMTAKLERLAKAADDSRRPYLRVISGSAA